MNDLSNQLTKEYANPKQISINTNNGDYQDILAYNSGQSLYQRTLDKLRQSSSTYKNSNQS